MHDRNIIEMSGGKPKSQLKEGSSTMTILYVFLAGVAAGAAMEVALMRRRKAALRNFRKAYEPGPRL